MASAIIHYTVSCLLLKNIEITDQNRFLLGATLGPDASSHIDGTYDIAHFGCKTADGSKKGIHWKHFAEKYDKNLLEDDFFLGYFCHLIQDAIWLHDVADKYVRCYQKEEKETAIQRGYRDYERLNYLLIREFRLQRIEFDKAQPPLSEISTETLLTAVNSFEQWFDSSYCSKDDLDIYKWNRILEYIGKCISFCASEISSLRNKKRGVEPEELFVRV